MGSWTNKPAYEPAPPVSMNPWYDGVIDDQRDHRQSLVYLMECGDSYKVGITTADIERRRGELQVGSAVPIVVIAVRAGGRPLERIIHKAIQFHSKSGEWFTKCAAVERAFYDTKNPDDEEEDVQPSPVLVAAKEFDMPLFDVTP